MGNAMKANLLASITLGALVSAALAAPVAAEPLRLTEPQMDSATAGGTGLQIISAAIGSQFSHSQASIFRGEKSSAGFGRARACCGSGSLIKFLAKGNGLDFSRTFRISPNRLNSLTFPSKIIPFSGRGISGKIKVGEFAWGN